MFSHAKTAFLHFTRKHLKDFQLSLDGQPQMSIMQHQFLGVVPGRELSLAQRKKIYRTPGERCCERASQTCRYVLGQFILIPAQTSQCIHI